MPTIHAITLNRPSALRANTPHTTTAQYQITDLMSPPTSTNKKNPYLPVGPCIEGIDESPIAGVSHSQYLYQIGHKLYFPEHEEALQKMVRDATGSAFTDIELTAMRDKRRSQTASLDYKDLRRKVQLKLISMLSWQVAFPNDWSKYDNGSDVTEFRTGAYVETCRKLMSWGLNHSDAKVKAHFEQYRCPCTGKTFGSAFVFLTRNIGELYLQECSLTGTKFPGLRKDKSALNSLIDACQSVCDFTCPGVSLGGPLNFDKGKDYVSQANENSRVYKVAKAASMSVGGKILKQPDPQRLCNDDRPFTDEELVSCNLYFLLQIPAEGYKMPRGASSISAYPRARTRLVFNMLHHTLCRGADLRHPAVTVQHTNMYLVNEG